MKKKIIAISCLIAATATQASDYQIGFAPGLDLYHITSGQGDSETISELSLIKAEIIKNLDNKSRVSLQIEILDTEAGASKSEVGQEIKGNVSSIQYQHKVNYSRKLKLWFGGGITLQNVKYSNRAYIDADGYKDTSRPLSDIEDTEIGLVLSVHKTQFLSEETDISLTYNLSENGINGFSVNLNWYPEYLNF